MVGCDGNSHHPIVCEVEECAKHGEEKPQALGSLPLKPNHGVHYEAI
jgi:hypothetical protein